ncbi:MAG: type II secretory pathway component GspD/PulD (secretin) [Planctomycetota bacterium]|jgi:type II secretory pathway component GspD/PulD (secretin)
MIKRITLLALLTLPSLAACRSSPAPADAQSDQGQDRVFEIVQLEHASAPEVSDALSALVFAAAEGGTQPDIGIQSDQRTNSLLLTATSKELQHLLQLIERLDVER